MSPKNRRIVSTNGLIFLAAAIFLPLAVCQKSDEPSYRVFASPDLAGEALQAAAKSGDEKRLLAIFGPDAKELLSSGDAVQDKAAVEGFVARYGVMHRWRKMPDESETLVVGADNFPFPIPLKKSAGGQWFFDTVAGEDEILSRRIGRDELAIIDVCRAVADAQAVYFAHPHDGQAAKQYAMKFISDPGKQNGLYWKSPEGQPRSPLGPLAASAAVQGYSVKPNSHAPFHGYYFHMLEGQGSHAPGGAKNYVVDGKMTGGFAFVAYPAKYGNSGVMTFMISQDGLLFQKNLGKTTAETAAAMTEFDPDASWSLVEQ